MDYHVKYGGKLLKFADKLIKMAKEFVLEGLYYLRVIDGGGTVANRGLVEDLYKLWDEQGRLDNIKVAILPQAGSVQRESGAYRFFSKLFGLLPTPVQEKRNLILYSEQFDHAEWLKQYVTVTANQIENPIDGEITADLVDGDGDTRAHLIRQPKLTTGQVNTVSVYAKAGTLGYLQILDNSSSYANFDLLTGTVGTVGGTVITATSITPVGDGWYRCTARMTNPTNDTFYFGLIPSETATRAQSWATSAGVYLFGAQVELASTASAYQKMTDGTDWTGRVHDVTQTTANSQPYVVNGAMVNPNGAARFMTHPTVSFGAGDAWSLSVLVDWTGVIGGFPSLVTYSGSSFSRIYLSHGLQEGSYYSQSGDYVVSKIDFKSIQGKKSHIVFTGNNGTLNIYINGVLKYTYTIDTSFLFLNIGSSAAVLSMAGSRYLHTIESGALTPTQILEEYNLLRSYIPEIATTVIGTDEIATENCQMVATPMGRVITLQNTPATWATASTIYANTYAATSGTVEQKTSAALLAAAMWRSPDADHDKQAVFGKIFNDYAAALMRFDIDAYNTANPSTPWGYHVMTRAEEQALAALDADTLKSNNLWTSTNGTNETGLSLLGTGVINADGTYSDFGGKTRLMTGEGYALDVNDDGTSAEIAVTTEGGILRLVKD